MPLCSVDDVKTQAQITTGNADARITELIEAASVVIAEYSAREFEPPATNPQARAFPYDGSGLLRLTPYDIQVVSAIQVDTDTASPWTVPASEYRVGPLPATDGVYRTVEFVNLCASTRWPTRQVTVTGTWGFPTVPRAVEQACVICVRAWLTREGGFGFQDDTAGGEPAPGPSNAYSIPAAAKRLLRTHKAFVIA